jgi:Ni/Co efflux regulator RcnB
MKRILLTLIVVLLAGSPLLVESSPAQFAATGKQTRAFQAAKHRKHVRKHHRKQRKRHRRTIVRRTAFNQAQSQIPAAHAI